MIMNISTDYPINLNSITQKGLTVYHLACSQGKTAVVDMIAENSKQSMCFNWCWLLIMSFIPALLRRDAPSLLAEHLFPGCGTTESGKTDGVTLRVCGTDHSLAYHENESLRESW